MRSWAILMRVLFLVLLLAIALCYWAVTADGMPVVHRVPTQDWVLYSHYCCSSRSCEAHHLETRFKYDWSH